MAAGFLLPPGLGESRAADARIEENERTAPMPFAPFTVDVIRPLSPESCRWPRGFVRQKSRKEWGKLQKAGGNWGTGRRFGRGTEKATADAVAIKGKVFIIFFARHA